MNWGTDQLDAQTLWETMILPWGTNILFAIGIFVIGRWVVKGLSGLLTRALDRSKFDQMLTRFVVAIARTVMTLFVIIAALSQLGINTTSLVALVGAAGLAVGLALKDSLQNFAAGVMLLINKPFKVGDYVEAAGTAGIVEHISIFNTVFRATDNKEILIPNGNIYQDNIVNHSTRPTRRADMVFGIAYGDDIRVAKQVLEKLVAEDERIHKDPAPTVFISELGDSSVNFAVRPWVDTDDLWPVKWDMNEKVKLAFDEAGLSIPFPQMDLHLHQPAPSSD
ncbi:MAG: mechanosensitive ion channel [Hydrogenovibrio sp.]|uniref:mechanosensitive ion channel family protein n=1 Tax=Hydrogenovibrio sp. TaxID=2065821 RepID=UPI00287022E2|nr:mechanosensitive ion channel domain-containing protein [Hydrogenovibrio sp.]MDR9498644.1 mechanosensitive ion channel [Hydrogenovibrio sp.]